MSFGIINKMEECKYKFKHIPLPFHNLITVFLIFSIVILIIMEFVI
jgi:hypothetical protein